MQEVTGSSPVSPTTLGPLGAGTCRATAARGALDASQRHSCSCRTASRHHASWYPMIQGMSEARIRTLYQQLQLDPLADPEIVVVVYRRLAQRYHPDHN